MSSVEEADAYLATCTACYGCRGLGVCRLPSGVYSCPTVPTKAFTVALVYDRVYDGPVERSTEVVLCHQCFSCMVDVGSKSCRKVERLLWEYRAHDLSTTCVQCDTSLLARLTRAHFTVESIHAVERHHIGCYVDFGSNHLKKACSVLTADELLALATLMESLIRSKVIAGLTNSLGLAFKPEIGVGCVGHDFSAKYHADPVTGAVHFLDLSGIRYYQGTRIVPYVFGCTADLRLWHRMGVAPLQPYSLVNDIVIGNKIMTMGPGDKCKWGPRIKGSVRDMVAAGRRLLGRQPLARLTWRRLRWLSLTNVL